MATNSQPPWMDFQQTPAAPPAPQNEGLSGAGTDEGGPWADFQQPAPVGDRDAEIDAALARKAALQYEAVRDTTGRVLHWNVTDPATGHTFEARSSDEINDYVGVPREARVPEAAENPPPEVGMGEAAWRGAQSAFLPGVADEWAGFWGAVGNKLGTALGMNESTADFWDIYQRVAEDERRKRDAAWEQHPVAYGAGFVPGVFGSGAAIARGALKLAPNIGRTGLAATTGGVEGAISGAGNADQDAEGNFLNRVPSAVGYGLAGAALGPVADRAFSGVSAAGRRAWDAVRPNSRSADSGLEALASRTEADPTAMRTEVQRLDQAGVPARLVDVVDDEGRAVIREAAERSTPARAEVAQHAESVYADAPERIAQQGRRISGDRRTARQLADEAEAGRDEAMTRGMTPIRGQEVDFPEDSTFWDVMATAEGRSAARYAAGLVRDPATKNALLELGKPQKLPEGYDDIKKMHDQVRALGLPPAAEERALAQLPPLPEVPARVVTIDMVDKIARGFNDAAEVARRQGNNGRASVLNTYANDIRAAADEVSPDYARLRQEYGAASRVAEAGRGEGRFTETEFLRTPPDQYLPNVREASDVSAAVPVTAPRDTTARLRLDEENGFFDDEAGEAVSITNFTYTSRAGDEVPIMVMVRPNGAAEIDVSWSKVPNKLGPAEIRNVMADIQEAIPGIKTFSGERISGARAKSLRDKGFVEGDEVPESDVVQEVPALTPEQMARTAPTRQTVSEQDALRVRSRDEVVDAALEKRGQNAVNVARQVANGPNQRARNATLLGGRGARELEEGMGAEVRRVENTRAIDPRAGQQPRVRTTGDAIIDGFENAVMMGASAASGSRWGVIHTAARWLKQGGIRNVDAERLARDAISEDPRRVEAAINYLEQRGMRRERAKRFITIYASALAGKSAAPDSKEKAPPPNSVRAILRDGRQIQ